MGHPAGIDRTFALHSHGGHSLGREDVDLVQGERLAFAVHLRREGPMLHLQLLSVDPKEALPGGIIVGAARDARLNLLQGQGRNDIV